jgi:hypothetical protein
VAEGGVVAVEEVAVAVRLAAAPRGAQLHRVFGVAELMSSADGL